MLRVGVRYGGSEGEGSAPESRIRASTVLVKVGVRVRRRSYWENKGRVKVR